MSVNRDAKSAHSGPPTAMPAFGGPRGPMGMQGMPKASAKDFRGTIRRLWKYLAVHRWMLMLVIVTVVVNSGMGLLGPYVLGLSIDNLIYERGDGILPLILLLGGIYLLLSLSAVLQNYWMIGISQKTVFTMRGDLFRHLHRLPIDFFVKRRHGELMSRVTNDIDNVSSTLNSAFIQILSSVLTFLGMLVFMLWLSPLLTLVTLLIVPLMFLGMRWITSRTGRLFKEQQRHLGDLNGYVEETVSGQRVVKIFSQEKRVIDEFMEKNRKLRDASYWAQVYSGFIPKLMNVLNNGSFALIAAVGGWLALRDVISVGTIVVFAEYSRQFTRPLNDLANQFNTLLSAVAGAERVFEVMEEKPEFDMEEDAGPGAAASSQIAAGRDPGGNHAGAKAWGGQDADAKGQGGKAAGGPAGEGKSTAEGVKAERGRKDAEAADGSPQAELAEGRESFLHLDVVRGEIRFENVGFSYAQGEGKGETLRGINLHVKPGETLALVGPTGAGKTTITSLLARFYDAQEGRILIDGHDIRMIERNSLRRHMGFVLQDTFLFEGTIRENIRYGRLDATDKEVVEAARLANAHSFIMQLPNQYDTVLSPDAADISQGQRQLLAIARAILADPAILILDEATSSIDTITEIKIQEALYRLMKDRTSIVVAHRLNTIQNADQIVVLHHGEILEHGTHESLLAKRGFYYELYQSQFTPALQDA